MDNIERDFSVSDGSTDGEESLPVARKSVYLASLALVLIAAGLTYAAFFSPGDLPLLDSPAPESVAQLKTPHTIGVTETPDSQVEDPYFAKQADLLGTWVLDDGIRRVIENRADGTATMHVTFNFLTSLRYGSKLTLQLNWTLEDNVLTHTIVSGTPESSKKTLTSDFGDSSYFEVLNITNEKMFLRDFDDPPESYTWARVDEHVAVEATE